MTLAFLCLSYGEPVHPAKMLALARAHRLYLHAKHPERVGAALRPCVIAERVPTEWGRPSIVAATLALLRAALAEPRNERFVLVSGDAFPLCAAAAMGPALAAKDAGRGLSMFEVWPRADAPKTGYIQTSQWWALTRRDAERALAAEPRFAAKFERDFGKDRMRVLDEYYFLNLLRWLDPAYAFLDTTTSYVDFARGAPQKSPKVFRRLSPVDRARAAASGALFLRKAAPDFSLAAVRPKALLWAAYVGTGTDQPRLARALAARPDVDLVVLSAIPVEELRPEVFGRALAAVQIIHSMFYEAVAVLAARGDFADWPAVLFATETFDLRAPLVVDRRARAALPKKRLNINGVVRDPATGAMATAATFYGNPARFFVARDGAGARAFLLEAAGA